MSDYIKGKRNEFIAKFGYHNLVGTDRERFEHQLAFLTQSLQEMEEKTEKKMRDKIAELARKKGLSSYICDCRCHKEFPSHLKGNVCPHCHKKDTGEKEIQSDLLPFKHGEEGTHYACEYAINHELGCCGCNGHNCHPPKKEHKIGEHGAVGYMTQKGRVCTECGKSIEEEK